MRVVHDSTVNVPETKPEPTSPDELNQDLDSAPVSTAAAIAIIGTIVAVAFDACCNSQRLAEENNPSAAVFNSTTEFVPVDGPSDGYGEFVTWPGGYEESN